MASWDFLTCLDVTFHEATIISILVRFARIRVKAAQDLFFGSTLVAPLTCALREMNRAAYLELDVLLVSRVLIGFLAAR